MSTIIECRNEPALQLQPLSKNGDWVTNLQRHVPIYEGDTIIARNCFIDTKASNSQKIVVEEDLQLDVDFYIYNVNWQGAKNTGSGASLAVDTTNSSILPINATAGQYYAKNDGELYINCRKDDHSGRNLVSVGNIPAVAQFLDLESSGLFRAVVLYVDSQGRTVKKNITIPEFGAVVSGQVLLKPPIQLDIIFDPSSDPVYPTEAGAPLAGTHIRNSGGFAMFNADGQDGVDYTKIISVATPKKTNVNVKNLAFPNMRSRDPAISFSNLTQNDAYVPIQYSKSIILEGGRDVAYDPTELAKAINRQFTKIDTANISSGDLTGDNKFLQSFGKKATGDNIDVNNHWVEMTTDGIPKYEITPGGGLYGYQYNNSVGGVANDVESRWGGASQVELDFNPTTKRFAFSYLHTPFYDAGSIGVGMKTATESDRVFPITKNGGIMLRNLTAKKVSNGQLVANFWEQTLGFGEQVPSGANGSLNYTLEPLITPIDFTSTKADGSDIKVNGGTASVPVFPKGFVEGVNITGGFQGLDTVVQKGDSKDPNSADRFFQPPTFPLPTGNTFLFSTSDDTVQCEAVRSVVNGSNQLNSGYFLVEVKAEFQNQFLTPDTNRGNVAAIVSRYYQLDSYTSAEAGASVIYKHTGPPQLLNSFNCRILDPNGNLATGIGSDNSIFMEIIRAPPKPMMPLAMPPPEEKEKEKKEA